MRVKNFHGSSVNEVMKQIRESLGDDAVIISTTRLPGGGGVQVTAALEADEGDEVMIAPPAPSITERTAEEVAKALLAAMHAQIPEKNTKGAAAANEIKKAKSSKTAKPAEDENRPMGVSDGQLEALRALSKVLNYHNCPGYLIRQLIGQAERLSGTNPGKLVLTLLAQAFDYDPVQLLPGETPVMLIGPPGVGKTMTVAKMLTDAAMKKIPVAAITTDSQKAGGVEQLHAFTELLGIALHVAETPKELSAAITKLTPRHAVIIDTAGYNPYDTDELKALGQLISSHDIEPVLVCNAGMDGLDAADIASNFAYLGAQKLIVTKIDTARRYGSILTAAHAGNFALSHFSRHAGAVDGLDPVTPERLAKILLHSNVTQKVAP
jgi:flagellar biosynthesis protein FlhF